jgi:hypothetical protein
VPQLRLAEIVQALLPEQLLVVVLLPILQRLEFTKGLSLPPGLWCSMEAKESGVDRKIRVGE